MKLFGTDGVRGRAGVPPLDESTVARLGAALARQVMRTRLGSGARAVRVLVGRDTRESGVWIEQALARGLASEGAEVTSAGLAPTPEIAFLTRSGPFDAGLVISASHNPYEDNGIKVFSGAGQKLAGSFESDVEAIVADDSWDVPATAAPLLRTGDFSGAYLAHLRDILADAGRLRRVRVVVDCAHGATAELAPVLMRSLGLDAVAIGVAPNGRNINLDCGSTHLATLSKQVIETGAALGIAFDGDGDRALFVDHQGQAINGDAILLMNAIDLAERGELRGSAIVATVMSNVGLELALKDRGITLVRCPVGDKYVMEEMQRRGLALGGEQSGHVIFADHLFTGDGLATALHVLRIVAQTGRTLADLASALVSYPQVLLNVRVRQCTPVTEVPQIADTVRRIEAALESKGRLLIRYSGTEPLLRIMIEGQDQAQIHSWATEIADAVRANLS
jgi:phosphoglucosamine mutase